MKWIVGIVLSACLSSPAMAQFQSQQACDGCSLQEMQTMALQKVTLQSINSTRRNLYVTNIIDGTVVKSAWRSNYGPGFDPETDELRIWGELLPVESQVQDVLTHASQLLPNGGEYYFDSTFMPASTQAKANPPGSIYELMNRSDLEISIHNKIWASQVGEWQALINDLNTLNPFPPSFNPANIRPTARLWMPDGSYALYAWDAETSLFKRIPKSARDSNGNRIPETVADVTEGGVREYNFPAANGLADFMGHLGNMNVSIIAGGGSGSNARMACSSVAGGTPVCRLIFY